MHEPDVPRFLLRTSPLVAGGKARLMSNKKVKPKPAEPREVSGDEVHGYTDQQYKALREEPEALSQTDYERHVLGRKQTAAEQQAAIEAARLAQAQRLLTAEQRLQRVRQEARSRCMDISSEARMVESMLRWGKEARHVEQRLGAVERRVYREAA